MSKNLLYVTIGMCLLIIVMGGGIIAQPKAAFPARSISLIVSAGGNSGFQAYALESGIMEELNQPLAVVNRLGGGGTDGWNELARAGADGYTIGISNPELILHSLYKTGNYHYLTALEPLAQIAVFSYVLVVDARKPWRNLRELIDDSRENPGQIKYGHRGIGSMQHMMGAAFGKAADLTIKPVPYRNRCESVRALHDDHIQILFASPSAVKEEVRSGRLRVIAITGEERMKAAEFSSAPTLRELGIDLVFEGWIGIAAPQEMEPAAKDKLKQSLKKIINDPNFAERIGKMNMRLDYLDSDSSKVKWLQDYHYIRDKLAGTGVIEELRAQQQ